MTLLKKPVILVFTRLTGLLFTQVPHGRLQIAFLDAHEIP